MKMQLINGFETIEKDFNAERIITYRMVKGARELEKRVCRLSKYSISVMGYKHQLELDGYKEVKELSLLKYLGGNKND